jgi:hypothetical protein
MNKYLILPVIISLAFIGCRNKPKETSIAVKEVLSYSIGEDINKNQDTSLLAYESIYLLTEDLDGDGVRDNISIKVHPLFFISSIPDLDVDSVPAILLVNDKYCRLQLNYNYLNGIENTFNLKVVDIDTTDAYKEVALTIMIHGEDPPGDYQIFRYLNNQLIKTKIPGDNQSNDYLQFNKDKTFSINYTAGYDRAYDVEKKFTLYEMGLGFLGRDSGKVYSKNPNTYLIQWVNKNLNLDGFSLINNESFRVGEKVDYQKNLSENNKRILQKDYWLGGIQKPISSSDISVDSNMVLSIDLTNDEYDKKLIISDKYFIISYHLKMGSDGNALVYNFQTGTLMELPEMNVLTVNRNDLFVVGKDYYEDGHVWETGLYNIRDDSYKTILIER